MSRFVRPETQRIQISNGDWLLVKKRLTAGEQRAAHARMYVAGVDGSTRVNPLQVGVAMTAAYLLDWSFPEYPLRNPDGSSKSVDDITAALDALDPVDFDEVNTAVSAHELAMAIARDAEKKIPNGEPSSSVTSPSHAGAIGALTGSET